MTVPTPERQADDIVRSSLQERERGNQAPSVITPRAIVRLVGDTIAVIRRRWKS